MVSLVFGQEMKAIRLIIYVWEKYTSVRNMSMCLINNYHHPYLSHPHKKGENGSLRYLEEFLQVRCEARNN